MRSKRTQVAFDLELRLVFVGSGRCVACRGLLRLLAPAPRPPSRRAPSARRLGSAGYATSVVTQSRGAFRRSIARTAWDRSRTRHAASRRGGSLLFRRAGRPASRRPMGRWSRLYVRAPRRGPASRLRSRGPRARRPGRRADRGPRPCSTAPALPLRRAPELAPPPRRRRGSRSTSPRRSLRPAGRTPGCGRTRPHGLLVEQLARPQGVLKGRPNPFRSASPKSGEVKHHKQSSLSSFP
jgi:hypothetical protein